MSAREKRGDTNRKRPDGRNFTEKDREKYKHLPKGYVFKGKTGKRYMVTENLGEGGMGAVYKVEEMESKRKYAVKCEAKRRYKPLLLSMEKFVYKLLNNDGYKSSHWPKYKDSGQVETFGWMAMQLVGPDLISKGENAKGGKFSSNTCLQLALQMLDGLQCLHDKGIVHRDLKPNNIALGLGSLRRTVIIIDVGLARQYKNIDGVPHRPRLKIRFKGTRTYAPLALLKGEECGPKDDLESWMYIMALMSTGEIKWQGKPDEEIIRAKEEFRTNPKILFGNSELSGLNCLIWKYVTSLRYEDNVDYQYIRCLLSIALQGLGGTEKCYDWEEKQSK